MRAPPPYATKCPSSKPVAVEGVRGVLKDLADGNDPDKDLEEPEDRDDQVHPRYRDDPHRPDSDLTASPKEDELRDNGREEDHRVDAGFRSRLTNGYHNLIGICRTPDLPDDLHHRVVKQNMWKKIERIRRSSG